ncbi:MAG: amino acid ABC transporter permease [Solirubrobacteraceae bacterium]|nr:amino acid ABC transporter permease [Solirubrobacteraceae bacterium]
MVTAVADGRQPEEVPAIPVRHYGRWVVGGVLLVLIANLVYSVSNNPRFEWGVVGQYLLSERVLDGVVMMLELTVISMGLGITLGVVLAVMRMSPNPLVSGVSWMYVWFVRGTPLLVQLLFWSFIAALYPRITFGVPFGGPELFGGHANVVITPFVAAILGLGLNEGAYMAEIVRAGILSVDEGQVESAHSLGMTRLQTLRRIVLPQAMRVIIPPTGNETIQVLKTTSLVSVIAVVDLLYAVQLIYSQSYQQIPLLIVACVWYLVFTTILSIGQYYIERHYGRGTSRQLPLTPIQRGRLLIRRMRGVAAREGA